MANRVAEFVSAYGSLFNGNQERRFGAFGGAWAATSLGVSETNPYKSPTERLAWYRGWIYRAVSTVAADMSSLKVKIVRGVGDDEELVLKHPLRDLLRRPTKWMRSGRFKQRVTQHLLLSGESFIYPHRPVQGRPPTELHILQPERTIVVPDPADFVKGYLYNSLSGEILPFLADEIYHLKLENPYDPYRGMSPVQALGWTPDIEEGVRAYVRNYLRNAARPDLALVSDQDINQAQAEEIRQRWEESHRSYTAAGRVAVLGKGTTPVPFTPPLKDLAIAELAGWGRDEILAAYNVPAAKLGLVADSNRSNSEAADHTYRSNALNPLAELFNQDFYEPLSEEFPDDVRAFFEDPVPADQEREFDQATEAFRAAGITRKEYLHQIGSPYADDAEDVYLLPAKMQVVPRQSATTPDDDAGDESDDDGAKRTLQSRIRSLASAEYRERKAGAYDPVVARKRWADALGDRRRAERIMLEIERSVERYGLVEAFERLKGRGAKAIARTLAP
ncbi:MAG TPA: phage portal protein [Limnochordia bacterium]|nr:phage portal protein [Limnochordia bacterium]